MKRRPIGTIISTDDIVERITQAVCEQRLALGTKLREETLCEVFGVSRTKVRQALNRLAQTKLITLRPRRGAFIAEPTAHEASEIFEARRIIEREMIASFAEAATPAQIAALRKHIVSEKRAIRSGAAAERNRLLGEFHIRIAEFVGNRVLLGILSDLVARSSLITLLFQSTNAASCSSSQHDELLAAIEKRDCSLVVRLMDTHLEHVQSAATVGDRRTKDSDLRAALQLPASAMARARSARIRQERASAMP